MTVRNLYLNVGVLIFLSLLTSLFIILSLKPQPPQVPEKKNAQNGEVSLAEKEIEIDEPQDIKLSIFAPFFYWKTTGERVLTLTKFNKDGEETEYPPIKSHQDAMSNGKIKDYVSEIKVGHKYGKVALIRTETVQGKLDDTIQIYDLEKNNFKDYSVSPDIYDFGTHALNYGSWSPNDRYLYFLYSSENEKDHNIWLIDTELKTSKIILNGYDINVAGWIDDTKIAYYVDPVEGQKDLDIMSLDIANGANVKVGYCPNIWLNQCVFSRNPFPEDDLLFSEVGNNTKIFVYNYKYQTGKELADALDNVEFARANILGFSPDRKYMFFGIHQSYTNKQPKEAGTYEYNLHGDYWRHIAKEEYRFVMWDKVTEGREVLLKEENNDNYFLHEVESFEIHPTKLPGYIFRIVG